MIFTRHLLSHFIDISHISIDEMCVKLSRIGLEVESVKPITIPKGVVVGRVMACNPHLDADKLNVCSVSVGKKELQIVCGAKNVAVGQYVAVALEGAVIPNAKGGELQIKPTKLRGVESYGMICSSTELGLPRINDGILILDRTAGSLELGREVSTLPLFDDCVIEVGITPNRGDCLSVLGIARELATCYDLRFKHEVDMEHVITLGLGRVLQILIDKKINAHLLYRVIEVKHAVLPLDIAFILAQNDTLGEDVICNFLEYGTYMTGVILNAYKLRDCENKDLVLDNGLVAQLRIQKDENGLEAVFANQKMSVVGVWYGERNFGVKSEILIIEASYVNPTLIAEQIYNISPKSDARLVYRSLRGSNPNLEQGIDFLCKKMVHTSDVLVYSGTHSIAQNVEEMSIKTTFRAINQIIGAELEKEEIAMTLKRLNFKLDATCDENFFMITMPNYRHDICGVQDVAEEVLRIYGIDNITPQPLSVEQTYYNDQEYITYKNTRALAQRFLAFGFVECIHYVFASSQKLERLGFVRLDENLELLNPITNELDTLRTSLLPTMIDSIVNNQKFGFSNVKLFELGSVYNVQREEKFKLGVVASGCMQEECYPHVKAKKWDFFAFARVVESCVGGLSLKNISEETDSENLLRYFGFVDPHLLHPYQSAFVYQDSKPIGVIAKLHPQIALSMDLEDVFICEVEPNVAKCNIILAQSFSKYQKSMRDLTIVVDKNLPFYKVRDVVLKANVPYVKNLYPIDVYSDDRLGGKIALSIRIVLQSDEKTLQESDLVSAVQNVQDILKSQFQAQLRS